MRATIENEILVIHPEDVPPYKRGGSVVRNSYFWALRAIACYSGRGKAWEFDPPVWVALSRVLTAFTDSGYLGYGETVLEFSDQEVIPDCLRGVSTYL